MNNITTPKVSEILIEEFMKPYEISVDSLATKSDVPISKVKKILQDNIVITPELSARLGRIFGVSDNYFLKLQADITKRKKICH